MTESTLAPALATVPVRSGLTLSYRELGTGPAVLLLHGWPTSSFLWRAVMPAIARTHRVLALDLPGFGGSDKPLDAPYDFDFHEAAIDDFLDAVGVREVSIAGHDLGGPIAVRWALSRQVWVRSLVLLNTLLYPRFSPAVIEFVTRLRTPALAERQTSPEGLGELMREGMADPRALTDEALAGVLAPFGSDDARQALIKAGYSLGIAGFQDLAARLGSLTVPVRVVYGERDHLLPDVADTFARLAADVPQAEITSLPDTGHFVMEERPDEVASLLAEFYARP